MDLCKLEEWATSPTKLSSAKPSRFNFLREKIEKVFDSHVADKSVSKRFRIFSDRSDNILNFIKKGIISKNQKVREHLTGLWLLENASDGEKKLKEFYWKEDGYKIDGNQLSCWNEYKKLKVQSLDDQAKHQIQNSLRQGDINTNSQPHFLFGIFEAYFIRPLEQKLAIGYVFLKPNGQLKAKTTATGNREYDGEFNYEPELDSLTCNFRYENRIHHTASQARKGKSIFHKFIIELFVSKDSHQRKYLEGIYGGNNPESGRPVAGRMMFKKIVRCDKASTPKCEAFFSKLQPLDINDAQNIANLLLSDYHEKIHDISFKENSSSEANFTLRQKRKRQIDSFLKFNNDCIPEEEMHDDKSRLLSFFSSDRYVENLEFITGVTAETDAKLKTLCGDYSVFTLHSSKIKVVMSSARIDRLGNIQITGRDGSLYSGKVTSFKDLYLNIAIKERTKPQERSDQKLYINYILKIGEGEKKLERYHGIRIIRAQNEKPNASRVIFKKEKYGFFKEPPKNIIYDEIPLFPISFRQDKSPIYDKRVTENELFKSNVDIVNFLTGDVNNLLVGYESASHILQHTFNYGQIFFDGAVKAYDKMKNLKEDDHQNRLTILNECIRYLDKACKNGFQGSLNIRRLLASDLYKDQYIKKDLEIKPDFFFSKTRFYNHS